MSDQARRRAAIYARFSSDLQSDQSIGDQIAVCRDLARREGLDVVATFQDRAKTSATLIGRDGIMDLLAQAQTKAFNVVIVEALDRLSRDQGDLAGIYKRLEFAGIRIQTVHEGRADIMSVGLRGLMGELWMRDLKDKTHRGLQGVVRSGRSAGGRSYGYAPVPGKPGELTIIDHEAETIRRIFRLYVDGATPREIAGLLNTEGVPPPRGKTWNASALNGSKARSYGILWNDLYNGVRIWNRQMMIRDPETGKRVSRVRPEEEWIREEVPALRIVPEDLFKAVRARRRQRTRTAGAPVGRRPKRPLSGLLVCGACGQRMTGQGTRDGVPYAACVGARESGTCDAKNYVRVDRLEQAVLSGLAETLRDETYVREYLRAYHEERIALAASRRKDRGALEAAASKAKAAFDRAHDLYVRGVTDGEDAIAAIRALRERHEQAKAALAEAAAEAPVVDLHPAALQHYLDMLDDLGKRLTDFGKLDPSVIESLQSLIARVVVKKTEKGLAIEVHGRLASLTKLPKSDEVAGRVVEVVAGAGFEPATFRL